MILNIIALVILILYVFVGGYAVGYLKGTKSERSEES